MKTLYRSKESDARGFTMIEILVIVGMLAVLAAIILAFLGGARERARIAKARAELNQFVSVFAELEGDTALWPGREAAKGSASPQTPQVHCNTTNNEVEDLNDAQAGLTQTHASYPGWDGPYIAEVPLDPWGNNYFFDTDYDLGGGVWGAVIGSYGPNGDGLDQYDSDDILEVLEEDICP